MTGYGDQLLKSALLEALNTVATPAVRDTVVRDALAADGLTAVPSDPEQFAAFVSGPLRSVVLVLLGDELGGAALAELERLSGAVLLSGNACRAIAFVKELKATRAGGAFKTAVTQAQASSHAIPNTIRPATPIAKARRPRVRKRRRSRNPVTLPIVEGEPTLDRGGFPLVQPQPSTARRTSPQAPAVSRILVSTTRAELVRAFASYVAPDVEVLQCWNVTSLVQALQGGAASTVVVVDCETPGAKASSVAALAEDFAVLNNTVLLGADAIRLTELARVSPRVFHWRVYAATAEVRDVAEQCAAMIG